MTILCDIDGVLLNTKKIKQQLAICGAALGVSPRQFWTAYRVVREQGEFTPEAIARTLNIPRAQKRKLIEQYWNVIQRVDQFAYADVQRFFSWCEANHHQLVLYTYGNPSIQRKKVFALRRLVASARAVLTTDRSKRRDLKKATHNDAWLWLDDFKDVPVHDPAFRKGKLLYVKRRKSQSALNGVPTVKNLSQARKLIPHYAISR